MSGTDPPAMLTFRPFVSTHEGIRRTRRIRNRLKVLENQSYIAGTDMVFLDYLDKELDRLSTEFSRVLPADTASGLVAPPGI